MLTDDEFAAIEAAARANTHDADAIVARFDSATVRYSKQIAAWATALRLARTVKRVVQIAGERRANLIRFRRQLSLIQPAPSDATALPALPHAP
jgi:hypothetical protein